METFFETLALRDGLPLHLDYHTARLNRTRREVFGTTESIDIATYLSYHSIAKIQNPPPTHLAAHFAPSPLHRLRIVYNDTAILSHTLTPYTPKTIRTIHWVESDIDYPHKSTDRIALNALLGAHPSADDILIVHNGYVRDTTVANVAFRQHGIWYTPDTPLLPGTTRARLINEGKLFPRSIHRDHLSTYDGFAITNALIGFVQLPLSVLCS
jgi:4-amino-4-deoxychorismate lyase